MSQYKTNKIETVIFDYNGTLTNDVTIGHRACNHMLKYYNVPTVTLDRFRKTFTTPWIKFYIANGVKENQINIENSLHQKEYQKIHTSLAKQELTLNEYVTDVLNFLRKKKYPHRNP